MKFYRRLLEALKTEPVVVATVIEAKGSVPREVGAKMFICADGRICDTIGGGAGEAKVICRAKEILRNDPDRIVESNVAKPFVENELTTQLVEIDLSGAIDSSGAPHRATEGICGGRMTVLLKLWKGASSLALVEEICKRLELGQGCILATPLVTDDPPSLLSNEAVMLRAGIEKGSNRFIECLLPPPLLLIIGAGHVGIELAKAAAQIEFQIILQDERPEQEKHAPLSDGMIFSTEPVVEILARLASHPQLYVALVSRAYQYDLEALQAILKRKVPCRYIGVIGSERRVRQVLRAVDKSGINETSWASIHAPIGLNIGALTPAEIAISIAAELILVRRGKSCPGESLEVSESKE